MQTFLVALRATIVTLVLTGILYPLAITAGGQLLFPHRANGSIVVDETGREVGSELIGQAFTDPVYVHSRPSASGYDAANSSGTNLGPTSKKLRDGQSGSDAFDGVTQLAAAYRTENGLALDVELPADAVTRSASGIDPDISPENAELQVKRIATARGVAVERVEMIVVQNVEGRDLNFMGEERVNVLAVNLALDRTFGRAARGTLPR
jgi:potassium-transporting ATPase KdpC subunit